MALEVIVGLATGAGLAAVFLLTLWMTTSMALSGSQRATTFVLLAALARVALATAGFVILARVFGPWALVSGLVAFIVVRTLVVSRVRRSTAPEGE